MFRSATTRIAHNSHVPGLASAALSKDLKALQDLINAEKTVQQSLQRLGVDIARASEAVKTWGNGEGDDLGDTLSACNALLMHFASALNRFYNYETTIREQMKAVRTREENLDEMKKRRKSLMSKADTADRKLNKMNAENKNFQAQADTLNKLREEIRTLDTEILNEEASLGDFKRSSAKSWMGMKFGALAECCEKGLIVSDLGKLVIAEIPLFPTEPGLPRPYYTGHANTEALVAESQQRIQQVAFSTEPAPYSMNIRQISGEELPPVRPNAAIIPRQNSSQLTFMTAPSVNGTPEPSAHTSQRYSQVVLSPSGATYMQLPELGGSGGLGMSSLMESDKFPPQSPRSPPPGSVLSSTADPYQPTQYTQSVPQTPLSPHPELAEFGMQQSQFTPRSSSLRNERPPMGMPAGPRDSHYGTFPLKSAGGPRPQSSQASGSSLSSAVPPRLDARVPSIELDRTDLNDSFESSVAEALGQQWTSDDHHSNSGSASGKAYEAKMHVRNRDYSPPPPKYSDILEEPSTSTHDDTNTTSASSDQTNDIPFGVERKSRADLEEEAELAYMSPHAEEPVPLPSTSGHGHDDRRVRFGGSTDIDDNVDEVTPHASRQPTVDSGSVPSPPATYEAPQIPSVSSPPRSPALPALPARRSLPTTPQETSQPAQSALVEDEKALNAAAAREVSRELDALMFSSPLKPADPAPPPSQIDPMQVPQPAFVRRNTPGRASLSLASPVGSPTSPRSDQYVRERDRSNSVMSSPTSLAPQSPTSTGGSHHSAEPPELQIPPVSIAMPPSNISAPSSTGSSPYRTPMEYPTPPAGPGSFYKMPTMTGSTGSFTPGGARTISAAAFKRQIRNPSSPPLDGSSALPDTNPLIVKKRLPGSPYPPSRLQPNDFQPIQGVSSAPDPAYQRGEDGRNRSSSGTYASQRSDDSGNPETRQSGPSGEQGDDDHYDYISAYVDDEPNSAQSAHGQEYGSSGRYNGGGIR